MSVDSRSNQRYGAVACQIHARGVHTSLLMDVAVSEDGLYAFGGVQRGSVELAAVYLGDVESYLDEREYQEEKENGSLPGLLDFITVDRHADAKLKGFGACTRLWNGWERARGGAERPEYLLFTGKGIKNIHIWSFKPSRPGKGEQSEWTCLYDTPTNGTSINHLYFRHNAAGTLQAISKSDDQKIRVWDLSYEQRRIAEGGDGSDRPRRPDYVDVASTEGTIGVCGPYAFASGSRGGMHNIINVVGLDADDVSSPFNCTELALPMVDAGKGELRSSSRTGRQRGDLKSVVHVAGLVYDAGHALLQLSDGSVVHYLHDQSGHPMLLQSPPSLCTTSIDDNSCGSPAAAGPPNKRMSLARVGSQGLVLFAVSSFNENTSRGAIKLCALPRSGDMNVSKQRKFWGFFGLKKKRKHSRASLSLSSETLVGDIDSTPVPATKADKSSRPSKTRPSDDVMDYTPVPVNTNSSKKTVSVRKVTPGELMPPPPPRYSEANAKKEAGQLDSQLESIVQGYNQEPVPSPKRKQDEVLTSPTKRWGKKKAASPAKDDAPNAPSEPKKRKVGWLGVTILDNKVVTELPESCYQPKERPLLLVEQLPNTTIDSRLANSPAVQSSSALMGVKTATTTATEREEHFQRHCDERQKLAAKHRAEHEMLRRKVLHSIRYVLSTWDIEANTTKSHASVLESAHKWFDDALLSHQEMLEDMLDRQLMEAESLSARQTADLRDRRAPMQQVAFPFPDLFEQARLEFHQKVL